MPCIQGEGRSQGTLFPVMLDGLVPVDHMCRVLDAFVERLNMEQLGFERSETADTGRRGYEAGFMVMGRSTQPAYNLQSAVDAEHALIIAHDVVLDAADNRSLEPMANAAKAVLGKEDPHVVYLRPLPVPCRRFHSRLLLRECHHQRQVSPVRSRLRNKLIVPMRKPRIEIRLERHRPGLHIP